MMKNQSTPIESTIPNNVEQNKSRIITIKPKEEISKVSTPDSASYASYASTPSTLLIITHSSVLYGSNSDSNDDLNVIELSVNNNDYDTDDNEDDIDSIPLIERLTPPPPLFINHLLTSSDDEYDEFEYDEYVDDEECTFYNLSIDIPSLNLSNASPIDEQKERDRDRCTIFEICNNVTPTNICYDVTSTPHINGKLKSNHEPIATEKRFNWDVPNDDKTYIINGYLSKHIHSLIDDNLSAAE